MYLERGGLDRVDPSELIGIRVPRGNCPVVAVFESWMTSAGNSAWELCVSEDILM